MPRLSQNAGTTNVGQTLGPYFPKLSTLPRCFQQPQVQCLAQAPDLVPEVNRYESVSVSPPEVASVSLCLSPRCIVGFRFLLLSFSACAAEAPPLRYSVHRSLSPVISGVMPYRRCMLLANLGQKHVTQFEERCLVQALGKDVCEHTRLLQHELKARRWPPGDQRLRSYWPHAPGCTLGGCFNACAPACDPRGCPPAGA